MITGAYYNEFDPRAAAWLRELIRRGLIAGGDVDERSIADVRADDLAGYSSCHFFAGIGGWSLALRIAGWPDNEPVWTGSCPCQPFSAAGKGKGEADERHLWPEFRRLIAECAPAIVFGEQVASAAGRQWLAGVRADLEGLDYAVGAADLCAAGVSAPHIRQRLYWVGHSGRLGWDTRPRAQDGRRLDRIEPEIADPCGWMGNAGGPRLAKRESEPGVLRAVGGEYKGQVAAYADRTGGLGDSNESSACEERAQRGWEFTGLGSNSIDRPWDDYEWVVIRSLCESGLVREIQSGLYRRVAPKPERDPGDAVAAVSNDPATSAPAATADVDALAKLAALAATLRTVARDVNAALTSTADQVEEAALAMEQRVTEASADGVKMRQLAKLLRDIGQ